MRDETFQIERKIDDEIVKIKCAQYFDLFFDPVVLQFQKIVAFSKDISV